MSEREWTEVDGDFMTVLIKFCLQQGFFLRELQAALLTVFVGTVHNPIMASMKQTGRWYAEQVSGKKGVHSLGAPLPHVAITVVKWMVKAGTGKVGGKEKEMSAILDAWTSEEADKNPEETRRAIFTAMPVLRISKAWTEKGQPQNMKIYFRCENLNLLVAMKSACSCTGMEQKQGMAPRGALERVLQKKLDNRSKKG